MYWVLPLRVTEGLNVAVVPLTFTMPPSVAPPAVRLRVKLVVFSVAFVIASERVTDTDEFSATSVAPISGNVSDTAGGVVSGAAAVVKFPLKSLPRLLPAASVTLASMVTVY